MYQQRRVKSSQRAIGTVKRAQYKYCFLPNLPHKFFIRFWDHNTYMQMSIKIKADVDATFRKR